MRIANSSFRGKCTLCENVLASAYTLCNTHELVYFDLCVKVLHLLQWRKQFLFVIELFKTAKTLGKGISFFNPLNQGSIFYPLKLFKFLWIVNDNGFK